jgi:hypothetical protein
MNDPFEDFLEDALGGPDLELGHEMRRRLLEAAVAGETISDGNVVRMDRPDPEEKAGFDWLVGEAPATAALLGRMIEDPAFMDTLDGQRGFIVTLRESLRRAAAAAVVPVPRRRWIPATSLAAAAALAMTTGILFFKPAPHSTAELVGGGETAVPAAARPLVPAPAMAAAASETDSPDTAPAPPAPAPLAIEIAGAAPPAPADPGGTGRSIEPDDPALVPQLEAALEIREGDPALPEPLLAMLGGGGIAGEDPDSVLLLAGNPSSWSREGMDGFGGAAGTGPGISLVGPGAGRDRETIPEPGGALLLMIGFMLMLLRRPGCRNVGG